MTDTSPIAWNQDGDDAEIQVSQRVIDEQVAILEQIQEDRAAAAASREQECARSTRCQISHLAAAGHDNHANALQPRISPATLRSEANQSTTLQRRVGNSYTLPEPPVVHAIPSRNEAPQHHHHRRQVSLASHDDSTYASYYSTKSEESGFTSLDTRTTTSTTGGGRRRRPRRVTVKGLQHTYDDIAAGAAELVQCPGCTAFLQVGSSAKNLFCTVCKLVSPMDLVRSTSDSRSDCRRMDTQIARRVQQQEVDVAMARKNAKTASSKEYPS